MIYAQQLLNQLQTTINAINQTLSTLEMNSSPFTNPDFSPEQVTFPAFEQGIEGYDSSLWTHGESTEAGEILDNGEETLEWTQAREIFLGPLVTAHSIGGTNEEKVDFGSTVTEPGTTPETPSSPLKKRKLEDGIADEEEYPSSFEEYMADEDVVSRVTSAEISPMGMSSAGLEEFGGGEEEVDSDEELRRNIERELDRVLLGERGDEVEEKERKVRCSDGSLRGQYEECP